MRDVKRFFKSLYRGMTNIQNVSVTAYTIVLAEDHDDLFCVVTVKR